MQLHACHHGPAAIFSEKLPVPVPAQLFTASFGGRKTVTLFLKALTASALKGSARGIREEHLHLLCPQKLLWKTRPQQSEAFYLQIFLLLWNSWLLFFHTKAHISLVKRVVLKYSVWRIGLQEVEKEREWTATCMPKVHIAYYQNGIAGKTPRIWWHLTSLTKVKFPAPILLFVTTLYTEQFSITQHLNPFTWRPFALHIFFSQCLANGSPHEALPGLQTVATESTW